VIAGRVLATLAVLAAIPLGAAGQAPPTGRTPAALAGLSARAAADSADRRMRDSLFLEALPFLEQVERATPRPSADFEGAFATALRNAAFQVREIEGRAWPATRSAVERVALVRESFRRVAAGEARAARPELAGRLILVRASQLNQWGFAREAYQEFWRAHDAHPLGPEAQAEAAGLERRLRDPGAILAPARRP